MVDAPGRDVDDANVDPEAIRRVVEQHPIRCAVLYGSHVQGMATPGSDIDVAVAFESDLTASDRLQQRIELTARLVNVLGTDDVDVADLDVIRPEVGIAAIESGRLLYGSQETLDDYLERFRNETPTDETHEDRMRRFDSVLDRLEESV